MKAPPKRRTTWQQPARATWQEPARATSREGLRDSGNVTRFHCAARSYCLARARSATIFFSYALSGWRAKKGIRTCRCLVALTRHDERFNPRDLRLFAHRAARKTSVVVIEREKRGGRVAH